MPIKLQKYDIESSVDNPEMGFMILGFDPQGQLVWKDENGGYGTVIPKISTQSIDNLEVKYLTIGIRLPGSELGLYSVGQGDNIKADGLYSFASGYYADATNTGSTSRGSYVSASGEYSYAGGMGPNNAYKLYSAGITSFVHSFANSESGTLSNYSVILGGYNHKIETGCDNSVILGGYQNIISTNNTNVAVIACNNLTTALDEAVYVPRIVLVDGGGYGGQHAAGVIEYESGRFKGYTGTSTFSYLDLDITSSLSTEISNRVSADSSLSNRISSEISSRTNADSSLSTVLSTEISNRGNGDTSLSTAISNEGSSRISEDSSLTTAISTETSSRTNYDTSLSTAISSVGGGNVNLNYFNYVQTNTVEDITLNTWYTISSFSLSTGKWLLTATVTMGRSGNQDHSVVSARFRRGGTTTLAGSEFCSWEENAGPHQSVVSVSVVTIANITTPSTTVELRGRGGGAAGGVNYTLYGTAPESPVSPVSNSTTFTAVKITN